MRAAAAVEVIGDIELFCRERTRARARSAVHRHHRHQRQIDDYGADRAHPAQRPGCDTQLGGNIGTRDPFARAAARQAAYYVIECSSYQIDLAPSLDPSVGILLNLTPDHLDRHGTMEHYAAVKERLVAGSDSGHRRRRRRLVAAPIGRPARARPAGNVDPVSAKRRAADGGYFVDGSQIARQATTDRDRGARRPRWDRLAARQPQRAECGLCRRGGLALGSGSTQTRSQHGA